MFDSSKENLRRLLEAAEAQTLQLPDFQRDWVWDEDGILALLVSIVRGFPVGAILTLEVGGSVNFRPRPLSPLLANGAAPREFLLDGQQRLTSLFQAIYLDRPVTTKTAKGVEVDRLFFADLSVARDQDANPEDWIVMTRGDGLETTNFGRNVTRDYSTAEKQYEAHMFPLNRVYREHEWMFGYRSHWHSRSSDVHEMDQALFRNVLRPVQSYEMPIIRLSKTNSREAICTVFEKVNTGGKKLDAFELLTAIYAADEFNLREDWLGMPDKHGRFDRIRGHDRHDVCAKLASTDFLQACTALWTMDRRASAEAEDKRDKELPPVTVRREAMLSLPLAEYRHHSGPIEEGYGQSKRFLSARKIIWHRDVPYPSQLITLAAVFSRLPAKERTAAASAKLEHWYWACVFGELYAGSVESRIARDIPELLAWIRENGPGPATIGEAVFRIDRLDTLRSRLAAAYKGVSARLMDCGARDFISGEPFQIMTYFKDDVDIHHIFPRKWCVDAKIPAATYDSIINKSPLSKLSNSRIGGDAPSVYLRRIEEKDGITPASLDAILASHLIDPAHLRRDDFAGFWTARREALAELVGQAMQRQAIRGAAEPGQQALPYDPAEEEEAAA